MAYAYERDISVVGMRANAGLRIGSAGCRASSAKIRQSRQAFSQAATPATGCRINLHEIFPNLISQIGTDVLTRSVLKVKKHCPKSSAVGPGVRRWRWSVGALLVSMLLKRGCGYEGLRFHSAMEADNWLRPPVRFPQQQSLVGRSGRLSALRY